MYESDLVDGNVRAQCPETKYKGLMIVHEDESRGLIDSALVNSSCPEVSHVIVQIVKWQCQAFSFWVTECGAVGLNNVNLIFRLSLNALQLISTLSIRGIGK